MNKIVVFAAVVGLYAASASAQKSCPEPRICSTLGFSFEPPSGLLWKTEFDKTAIQFSRKLDPKLATMHAGAVEGQTSGSYSNADELVAAVRKMKSVWGSDGRYRNIKESYTVEGEQSNCVRYRLYAEDTRANVPGATLWFPLLSNGLFCLHPKARKSAVDIFYSIRHTPSFGVADLEAEGESLLRSLKFVDP